MAKKKLRKNNLNDKMLKTRKRRRRKNSIKVKERIPNTIDIDEALKKINYVQINRKDISFSVESLDSPVINNLLKDSGVIFTKKEHEKFTLYNVSPGPKIEEGSHVIDSLEELDDEILEDD